MRDKMQKRIGAKTVNLGGSMMKDSRQLEFLV